MTAPAYNALRLHYGCWSKNPMPQRMVAGFVGMIYISAASVLGTSIISAPEGLDPEKPLTSAAFAGPAAALIAVMAYSSKSKGRFEHMDLRFYHRSTTRLFPRSGGSRTPGRRSMR